MNDPLPNLKLWADFLQSSSHLSPLLLQPLQRDSDFWEKVSRRFHDASLMYRRMQTLNDSWKVGSYLIETNLTIVCVTNSFLVHSSIIIFFISISVTLYVSLLFVFAISKGAYHPLAVVKWDYLFIFQIFEVNHPVQSSAFEWGAKSKQLKALIKIY